MDFLREQKILKRYCLNNTPLSVRDWVKIGILMSSYLTQTVDSDITTQTTNKAQPPYCSFIKVYFILSYSDFFDSGRTSFKTTQIQRLNIAFFHSSPSVHLTHKY